ncbi:MAG TPA: proton-conducting transporter membrane subunit, partial [Acidimicrobiales bacterium]|nr:proton-conducting transporter membrane subunit [Acidimicrobiales bacterium]
MLATLLAASSDFVRPHFDWHALAPAIVLVGTIALCLLVDVFTTEQSRWTASSIAGIGMLAALVPIFTLAYDNTDRVLFGGAFVVDDFALVLSGLFLVAGYLTILLSTNYIAEGDYAEGEYYLMLLSAVFGMVIMASARDLITIFIALEMLSIPAYLMAGWRKRTLTGNEAGMKYYLMGVFASGVMLYGMSLIFGGTGSTILAEIGDKVNADFMDQPVAALGIIFVLIGFAFKISAVPF